jgi:hypothetical protein
MINMTDITTRTINGKGGGNGIWFKTHQIKPKTSATIRILIKKETSMICPKNTSVFNLLA